jgi:hypothetical protein
MSEAKVIGYDKINAHPDKDEIIQRLIAGDSTRNIEAWLKSKYPYEKKKHISYVALQSFRKNYLNLEADALKQIQKQRKDALMQRKFEIENEAVKKTAAYQIGISNYVQDSIIDYNQEMLELIENCKEGVRSLKEANSNKNSHLNHQAITSYLTKLQGVIELHHKIVKDQEKKAGNRLADDYQTLEKKMQVIVTAVKEAFNQTNPEALPLFLQIVKEKMSEAGIES